MATAAPPANTIHAQFPLLFGPAEQLSQQKVQSLVQRLQLLKSSGQNESNPEFMQLMRFFDSVRRSNQQRQQQLGQQQQAVNGHPSQPVAPPVVQQPTIHAPEPPLPPLSPDPPAEPITLSQPQLDTLRAQIHAFKFIQRGLPVPPNVRDAIYPTDKGVVELKKELDNKSIPGKVVDGAVTLAAGKENVDVEEKQKEEEEKGDPYPKGPFMEQDTESGIYPYNAYVHPLDILKPPSTKNLPLCRNQLLLVPSLMPKGLDPYHLLAERNRFVDARIEQRIAELSLLTSTMGLGGSSPPLDLSELDEGMEKDNRPHGKLRALIELKSLQLRDKQRALRAAVVSKLAEASIMPSERKDYKRFRKQTIFDVRQTESLERKQRVEREKRVKQRHLDYLKGICAHGQAVIFAGRAEAQAKSRMARMVLKFHVDTEKEEQKRIERISKERLKALKNDDEEAYLKLIDTAKDTRITHLVRQTDAYLEGLAMAVQAQQAEDGKFRTHAAMSEQTTTDETTFGASKMDDDDEQEDGEKKKVDYYSIAHRITEKITAQPKLLVGGTLKDYQIKGLQWMVSLYNNRLNGILADEMGLGKTIQTISLITFLIETKHQQGPFLVIVPLSTLPNWSLEFEKWAPDVPTIIYKGSPLARKQIGNRMRMEPWKVMLTTFEYIIKDRPVLSKYKWVHMIIDEGHRMKNSESKLAQTLAQYYTTRYRLLLTGTPLQNNLPELWSLLNFVLPKIFNSVKSFDEWFNTPFANSGAQDNIQLNEEESLLVIRRLHKVLRPFLLRRLKKDVESELPDKVEKVIKCKMSALQSQLYKYMKEHKMFPQDKNDVNGKPMPVKGLQNMVMQLRKICQHPFVFREVENAVVMRPMSKELRETQIWNHTIIRSAGKVALLDRMLPKLFRTGHRVLIFFQMTNVMDILEDYMNIQGTKFLRLDGGTKTEDRGELLKKFNDPQSEYKVFMLSTRAGGLGLNLQTADTVIIYDSDWNPHADLQAQDRAHRIGQKKAVRIFRFITEKSVEEAILTRARSKLDMDEKVIQAGRFDNKSTAEERDEYLRQLIEDQDEESQDSTGDMTDEELNELLARSEEEEVIFKQMDIEREAKEQSDWARAGGIGTKPERLLTLAEIPPTYQQEDPFPKLDLEDVIEGRGARVRKDVRYTDGLTDEQFTMAVENDGVDYDDFVQQNAASKAKRSAAKKASGVLTSGQSTPQPDYDSMGSKKQRGRPKVKGKNASHEDSPVPSKRKRVKELSPSPSVIEDDDDDDDARPANQKRRKIFNTAVPALSAREQLRFALDECLKAVVNATAGSGPNARKRCELFNTLPPRKSYPDYYDIIANPIAISTIRKRISGNYYKSLEQYAQDWRTLFDNARRYNMEESVVHQDANAMQEIFESVLDKEGAVLAGGGRDNGSTAPSAPASLPVSDDEDAMPVRRSLAPRRPRVADDSEDDEYAGSD